MKKKQAVTMSLVGMMTLSAAIPVMAADVPANGKHVTYNHDTHAPNFVSGKLAESKTKSAKQLVLDYFAEQEGLYHLGAPAANSLKVISEEKDDLGYTHVKLQQIHKGVPVLDAVVSGHVSPDGVLEAVSGELVPNLPSAAALKSGAKVSAAEARQTALQDLSEKLGQAPELNNEAKPSFVVYAKGDTVAFAYAVEFEFLYPEAGNYQYVVDAHSGEIIDSFNQLHEAKPVSGGGTLTGTDSVGTGIGVLGDLKSFNTLKNSSGYYLVDRTRGSGIFTYDAKNRQSVPGTLWLDSDNVFKSSYDAAAVDAHVHAAETYDYYKDVFNRNSYDGNGAKLVSTVHYSRNYNNAFWSGSQMVYGDGDGSTFISLSGGLDVIAHELTHAVTDFSADLVYQNESGAINESVSDIFGTLVEYHYNNNPDWLIGEDIYTPGTDGDALRSMADPTVYGDPDHYSKRYTGTSDNGGVHWNSGISNKMAYLLANGGTHYGVSVAGIGNEKLEKVMYRTLTVYLTPNATFSQYRAAAVQAASDLYGASSAEVNSVKAAFNAVGVN